MLTEAVSVDEVGAPVLVEEAAVHSGESPALC